MFPVVSDLSKINVSDRIYYQLEDCFKDHSGFVYSAIFFHPNILVSCSGDSKINIYNLDKGKKVGEISDFSNCVLHMIKFSDTSFFACSRDEFVRGYELDENLKWKKILECEFPERLYKLMKLNDEEILVYVKRHDMHLFNVRSGKIVKTVKKELTKKVVKGMVVSKKYPLHYYTTAGCEGKYKIKLKDIEKDVCVKIYNTYRRHSFHMNCFIDSRNREILVSGIATHKILFFDSNISNSIMEIRTRLTPYSFAIVRKKYLFVGEGLGLFDIFSFRLGLDEKKKDDNCSKLIFRKLKFHENTILDLEVLEIKKNKVKICSCSSTGCIKVSSFYSEQFDLEEKYDSDEYERIEYMIENYSDFSVKFTKGSSGNLKIIKKLILLI